MIVFVALGVTVSVGVRVGVMLAVPVGGLVGVIVGVEVSVRVGTGVKVGVDGSPAIVNLPDRYHTSPTKICTSYSPGCQAVETGKQSV